ncbi:hypothetical protein [Pedobacter jeongneungensis]|uniref:hypothetical protein n=1 Tax=Pedobacter jeongneungensis TaxID=947309 RepID=UPI0031EFD657
MYYKKAGNDFSGLPFAFSIVDISQRLAPPKDYLLLVNKNSLPCELIRIKLSRSDLATL